MVPSRQTHDVLAGHLRVLQQFGALPRTVVWDQEGAIGQWRGQRMAFTEEFQRFRGTLGIGPGCASGTTPRPRASSKRMNGYFETSFLPGRRFEDVGDFNRQLTGWLVKANHRIHATTKVRPSEAVWEDRGSMLAFPPLLPDTSLRVRIRLPRDHYVAVDGNDYSVNPRFVGRRVDVRVTLEEVVAHCDGTEVARHRRCLGRNQTLLGAEHARVLRAMRAERIVAQALADAVEERDLAVYDRIAEVG